jgi:hypothetical protein
LVIVNACVEDGSLVALDRKTGKEAWRASGMQESWSTPLLVAASGGKRELVVSMEGSLLGFDPGSGAKLWQCRGVQDYVCPSTVAAGDTVYAIGGRQSTAVAVKVGGRGDVEPLWTQKAGSNVSSPVVAGDFLYWVSDRGFAICLNRHTGDIVYQQRLPGNRIEGYASALAADGKIYNVTRSNGTFVLAAKPEFEELANNVLDPDRSICNASPAVAGQTGCLPSLEAKVPESVKTACRPWDLPRSPKKRRQAIRAPVAVKTISSAGNGRRRFLSELTLPRRVFVAPPQ